MGLDVHVLDLNEHLNITPKSPFRLQSPSVTPLSQRFDWNNDRKELGKGTHRTMSSLGTRVNNMEDTFPNTSFGKRTSFYHKGVNRSKLSPYTNGYHRIHIPELYNHHPILEKSRKEVIQQNYPLSPSKITSPIENYSCGRGGARRERSYASWIPSVFVHQRNKSESEACFKRTGSLGNFELREQRRWQRGIIARMLEKLKRHLSTFW